jgi:mRNA interferase YafQ
MKRDVVWTSKFKKDYKLAEKRGLPIILLDDCIRMLAAGGELPPKYRDHDLLGNWRGHRECHIQGDWVLIYHIKNNDLILVLSRTGTHSDVF